MQVEGSRNTASIIAAPSITTGTPGGRLERFPGALFDLPPESRDPSTRPVRCNKGWASRRDGKSASRLVDVDEMRLVAALLDRRHGADEGVRPASGKLAARAWRGRPRQARRRRSPPSRSWPAPHDARTSAKTAAAATRGPAVRGCCSGAPCRSAPDTAAAGRRPAAGDGTRALRPGPGDLPPKARAPYCSKCGPEGDEACREEIRRSRSTEHPATDLPSRWSCKVKARTRSADASWRSSTTPPNWPGGNSAAFPSCLSMTGGANSSTPLFRIIRQGKGSRAARRTRPGRGRLLRVRLSQRAAALPGPDDRPRDHRRTVCVR